MEMNFLYWKLVTQRFVRILIILKILIYLNSSEVKINDDGSINGTSAAIDCKNKDCTEHTWNESEILPEPSFDRPILKNTVLVPPEGYAIVRFKAESPGWWPLHCHQSMHRSGVNK